MIESSLKKFCRRMLVHLRGGKILNDRPITRVSGDANYRDVLTPKHLLLLRAYIETLHAFLSNPQLHRILAKEFWLRSRKESLLPL